MSKPSTQKAAKKAAKRKEHNKSIRLTGEAARRAKQSADHKHSKRIKCEDLVTGILTDTLAISSNMQTVRKIVEGRIQQIKELKAAAPDRFASLTTERFDKLLEQLNASKELVTKLLTTAGTLEDLKKSGSSMADQMIALSTATEAMADAQDIYIKLTTSLSDANAKFEADAHPSFNPDKTLAEGTDELFDVDVPAEESPVFAEAVETEVAKPSADPESADLSAEATSTTAE